ncbi:hypothetical protein RRF57_001508 [Xylaria bambusicola]|uniref:Uncharacterized protein n=1 Tax=Xylaria bambusicola TaxID=326684 RepID=A0AAN7Z3K8_9PEZI
MVLYDPNKPAMEMEITPLNAVESPMLTSDRRIAMIVVTRTAYFGIPPGNARSREKAQYNREVDAIQFVVALNDMTTMMAAITAAPAVDPTAFLKMAI